jgi:hypothetical protein
MAQKAFRDVENIERALQANNKQQGFFFFFLSRFKTSGVYFTNILRASF